MNFDEMVFAAQEGNTRPFMERFYRVRAKDAQDVPFRLNALQLDFDKNKTNYDIILKPRQFGSSTYQVLDALTRTICTPHYQAAIVAHERDATERLFRTVTWALESVPEGVRPKAGHERTDYFDFPGLHSAIYIGTAGSRRFGRSEAINFLHLSEVPQWEPQDRDQLITGSLESVPKGGRVVWESTPHGVGDEFHQLYLDARANQSSYRAHFYPWYANPEFSLAERDPEVRALDRGPLSLTDEEISLMARYSLTMGQLRWRRWKLGTQRRRFFQEYPEDDVTCWLATEATVFDADALKRLLVEARPAPMAEQDGLLALWRLPSPTRRYVIGADPSGGTRNGDPACAVVISDDGREVACLHGAIPPAEFARKCVDLATRYHNALLGFEREPRGLYCAELATQLGYGNVYRHREQGRVYENGLPPLGYPASRPAKIRAIEDFQAAVLASEYRSENQETIRELLEYRHNPRTGEYGAPSSRHDDRAMASMIAWQVFRSAPMHQALSGRTQPILYPRAVRA